MTTRDDKNVMKLEVLFSSLQRLPALDRPNGRKIMGLEPVTT